jgi:hypothetical protein
MGSIYREAPVAVRILRGTWTHENVVGRRLPSWVIWLLSVHSSVVSAFDWTVGAANMVGVILMVVFFNRWRLDVEKIDVV